MTQEATFGASLDVYTGVNFADCPTNSYCFCFGHLLEICQGCLYYCKLEVLEFAVLIGEELDVCFDGSKSLVYVLFNLLGACACGDFVDSEFWFFILVYFFSDACPGGYRSELFGLYVGATGDKKGPRWEWDMSSDAKCSWISFRETL